MDDNRERSARAAPLRDLLRLLRPKQWIKNAFVLAPLCFTGQFLQAAACGRALAATVLFCLASSLAYVINDIHDVDDDRRHPSKARTRPLASGAIGMRAALAVLAMLAIALLVALALWPALAPVLGGYVALNLLYSYVLKHQPVIDIFTVAIGFVLRVVAGAVALDVPVSGWMFVTTLSLALYLAAIKRRQELSLSGSEGRRVLRRYSVALVDRYAGIAATGALVFYSMFVMSARPQLVFTVPLVLFGLFRYWYVVELEEGGESPSDALFSDWQLLLTVVLWIGACAWALWPARG